MTPTQQEDPRIVHCKDCIWFERNKRPPMLNLGMCHNQSPVIVPGLDHTTGKFPTVSEESYCGDGEARAK